MKPDLRDIFQHRLSGHEMPVDPSVWQAIQVKLPASADGLQEVFRDKFEGHEMDVDPGVWNSIGSQIGHGAASGGGLIGWAAAGVGVVAVTAGLYLALNSSGTEITQDEPAPAAIAQIIEKNEPEAANATIDITEVPLAEDHTPEPIENRQEPVRAAVQRTGEPAPVSNDAQPAELVAADQQQHAAENMNALASGDETIGSKGPEPAEGQEVVSSLIAKLEDRVKQEAMAAPVKDPSGPPEPAEPNGAENERSEKKVVAADKPEIFLQNTFTPNGDGINDTYIVDASPFKRMMIRVYSIDNNRLVFSTDTNEPWDGAGCQKGYYAVAVEAITEDGQVVTNGKLVWLNNDR